MQGTTWKIWKQILQNVHANNDTRISVCSQWRNEAKNKELGDFTDFLVLLRSRTCSSFQSRDLRWHIMDIPTQNNALPFNSYISSLKFWDGGRTILKSLSVTRGFSNTVFFKEMRSCNRSVTLSNSLKPKRWDVWPRSTAGLDTAPLLQKVGTVVQPGVFHRCWLSELDFYRAGYDIIFSSLFMLSLPKCLHQTRQKSHCLGYASTEVVHCVQQFRVSMMSLKGRETPNFCIFSSSELGLYFVLQLMLIFTRAALGLAWAFYHTKSSHFQLPCIAVAFHTELFYIKHLKPFHFKASLGSHCPFPFSLWTFFSWLFTHQVGKGKVELRVSQLQTKLLWPVG